MNKYTNQVTEVPVDKQLIKKNNNKKTGKVSGHNEPSEQVNKHKSLGGKDA